jgi:hypothetical protein
LAWAVKGDVAAAIALDNFDLAGLKLVGSGDEVFIDAGTTPARVRWKDLAATAVYFSVKIICPSKSSG